MTVGPGGCLVTTSVLVHAQAVFHFEQSLQAIAQVFDALEADTRTALKAGGHFVLAFGVSNTAGTAITIHAAQVSATVDGDVGLSESSGRGQSGDCQSDNLLLHQKISLVVSF